MPDWRRYIGNQSQIVDTLNAIFELSRPASNPGLRSSGRDRR